MARWLSLLIAALVSLAPAPGHALEPDKALHQYVRGNWSIEQGLPQISVTSIAQDRDGYLWVGTYGGLARFDGVRFTSYTPETEPALPGIYIRALHVARDGRLWIGTYQGVAVHDGKRFTAVTGTNPGAARLDIHDFEEDAAGTLWVATGSGLFRIKDDVLQPVPGSPAQTQSLHWHDDGLWVGTAGSVSRLVGDRWQTYPLPADARTAAVTGLLHRHERLWAATTQGLFELDPGASWRRSSRVPGLAQVPVELLAADSDGNLWVGGDAGVARLRADAPTQFDPGVGPGGLRGWRVAFEDREGGLWFGSQWNGLTRLGDSWTRRFSVAEGLADPIVWSLAADPDGRRTWVGNSEGVSVLEDGTFAVVAPGNRLPHPQAYNLLAERDRLWIGTRKGVAYIDHAGPRAGSVQLAPLLQPMDSAQINGIVRAVNGDLWFPTSEGLFRLRGTALRRFAQADGLANTNVRYFHRSHDGRIFVGTQGGLFRMEDERFVRVGTRTGLPADMDVVSIHELADGRLVVGTFTEHSYFSQGQRWHELGPRQGLPGNLPWFHAEHDGYLWIAGMRGITRVPVDDLAAFAEGRIDRVRGEMLLNERGDANRGQAGYCCNGLGNAKGFVRDGAMWLPSRDGVVALDFGAVVGNRVAPRAVVERVQVGEQWRPAYAVAGTRLPADARDLSFAFTVLSLADPKSTGVQYRLRGYDRDWKVADPLNRTARYTNLPPGDYVFEVAGSNNAGVASAAVAELRFAVAPRFHETTGFAVLLALLLLALVAAGYRYQQQRHRVQRGALETLVLERTAELQLANQQLEEASHTDPLTGLRNRRYTANQIPADLAYYDRQAMQGQHQDEVLVFAMVDIDHFKSINDAYGHAAGDLVLQQFAAALTGLLRAGDYVVRWGGEEFLLVFRPMPKRNLQVIGDRLRDAVNAMAPDVGNGRRLKLTCSIGLAEYPLFHEQHGRAGWEVLIELADRALYFAKEHGRDGWAAFRPTELTDLTSLLVDLRDGPDRLIASGRLQVLGSQVPAAVAD